MCARSVRSFAAMESRSISSSRFSYPGTRRSFASSRATKSMSGRSVRGQACRWSASWSRCGFRPTAWMEQPGGRKEHVMSTLDEQETTRFSRRGLLERAGAGAGAVALSGGVTGAFSRPVQAAPARSRFASTGSQTFGRLFPNLPPFAAPSSGLNKSLLALGAQGGLLDAQDQLSAGPINLITDPSMSVNNPDNPTHTAGTTFMGQFIDHDITFDTSSKLGETTDPSTSPNGRTPTLDLDSVYGSGPVGSSALYNSADR